MIVEHAAGGHALRYGSSDGDVLPQDEWIPMRDNTIFDMAPISKPFTAVVTMQLVERGLIDSWLGRGVYADAVRIRTPAGILFEDSRPADHSLWRPGGFVRSSN